MPFKTMTVRRTQPKRERTAQRSATRKRALLSLAGVTASGLLPISVAAQSVDGATTAAAAPTLTEKAKPALSVLGGSKAATSTIETRGLAGFELLRGNGAGSGYVLTHSAVLSDTLSVHVGGQRLSADRDYWLDGASGTLMFARPIPRGDSITVSYRYLDGDEGLKLRQSQGSGLLLNFGQNTSLGVLFGQSSGNGTGYDTSLNGLNLSTRFGQGGQSSFGGLFYFSNVQASQNVNLALRSSLDAPAPTKMETGSDRLIAQNLALKSGAFRLDAGIQDVGTKFGGFETLKLRAGGDVNALNQVKQLEAEKGIKRSNFGLGFGGDAASIQSGKAGGLSLGWNTIQDGKDSIAQRSADFANGGLRLHWNTRNVGEKFAAFDGLREADKTQWQREKGLTTNALGLGMNFGGQNARKIANGLNFASQTWGDKTGGLQNQTMQLNEGAFSVQRFALRSDAGFKRIGDLADGDKNALALNLYQQYDPTAKIEQVTAHDRDQIAKSAGLVRDGLRADLGLGKTGGLSFSQSSTRDTPAKATTDGTAAAATGTAASVAPSAVASIPAMRRQNLSLNTGLLTFDYTQRTTDKAFARIGDLTDIEKNALALDIRRQFDGSAKVTDIAQPERDQTGHEAGITRSNLMGSLNVSKSASFSFRRLTVADAPEVSTVAAVADKTATTEATKSAQTPDGVMRQTFGFNSKNFLVQWSQQAIAEHFAKLGDLSDIEKKQFANEHGLQRNQATFAWQLNKQTKIAYNRWSVAPTSDALAGAFAAADKLDDGDARGKARKAALSGLQRETVSLDFRGLTFARNRSQVGKDFTRAADLALSDGEKGQIEAERGFNRTDYALKWDAAKWLKLDDSRLDAADPLDKLAHDTNKRSVAFNPVKPIAFAYTQDSDIASASGKANGTMHSLLDLKNNLHGYQLNLTQDASQTLEQDKATKSVQTGTLHFETPQNAPAGTQYDQRRVQYQDGKFDDTTSFNVSAKPSTLFTVRYMRSDRTRSWDDGLDKAPEPKPDPNAKTDPSTAAAPTMAASMTANSTAATALMSANAKSVLETSEGFDLEIHPHKQFSVIVGVAENSTTSPSRDRDGNTVSLGLKGEPFPHVTLAARYDETHNDGVNTKGTADIALSNSKPFTFGPIHELTVTARYASLNDKRKLQNETMSGKAAWKVWKNEFLLDYGGITKEDGTSTISRIYSFSTDPNPKNWLHSGFYYKARTLVDGKEKLIRRFTADAKLSRATHFAYTYGTLPEDDKGEIQPQTVADVSLKHQFKSSLAGSLFYRMNNNDSTKILTRSLGFGVEGSLSKSTKLTLSYSKDVNGFSDRYDRMERVRFGFDQQFSEGNFLSLSTEVRTHDGKGLNDEIRATLDCNWKF